MAGSKHSRYVCSLTRLTLGLLLLTIVVLITITAVTTYFLTKDVYDKSDEGLFTTTTKPQDTTTTTASPAEIYPDNVRLNKTVLPYHYNVELQPYIYEGDDFSFDGKVEVFIRCEETTDLIVLHIDKLTINESSIQLYSEENRQPVTIIKVEEDTARQFLKFYLESPLEVKNYVLSMSYVGTTIHDDLSGFYRGSYVENGTRIYLASTQFQRTSARRAFPCFDEPSFKAKFNVTIIRRDPLSSIANMPLLRTEIRTLQDGIQWYADVYEESVIMSSYLVAFVVSDFANKSSTASNGVEFTHWARREYLDSLDFSLEVSGGILEAFENYTNISFVLPKMEQIALPDFSAGAMENWGLITYREERLLYNPDFSTTLDKEGIAEVIAHEIIHQWTGNLVTCDWWDETWLNEGFASYFEFHHGVDVIKPEWKYPEYFLRAMWNIMLQDRDGGPNSQPVFVEGIEHQDELMKAFDRITYDKGASVIRMMTFILGEDTFRKGLQNYLNTHKYGTAVRSDLYKALQEQAELDNTVSWNDSMMTFGELMDTFIIQQHYPLLNITVSSDSITVEQSLFLYDRNATPSAISPYGEYIWDIFFTFATKEMLELNTNESQWIYREKSVSIPVVSSVYMVANLFHQGYFRVMYDKTTYDAIIQQLMDDHTVFSLEVRGQIINDAFNLASAGLMAEVDALRVLQYLGVERDYMPWYAALQVRLPYIKRMMYSSGSYGQLLAFLRTIIEPTYIYVGWDNSNPDEILEKFLRRDILQEACVLRLSDCIKSAGELYSQVMNASTFYENIVHPDLRPTVYCSAIQDGGVDEWNHALDRYKHNYTGWIGSEKDMLLDALSCSKEQWIQTEYLEMGTEMNSTTPFTNMASKEGSQYVVWQFIDQKWEDLPTGIDKNAILSVLTDWITTQYELDQLNSFFTAHLTGLSSSQKQALEDKVKTNIKWIANNLQAITEFLDSFSP